MPSLLANLFNRKSSTSTPVGHTRTVNLSGNQFSFAMPEDFSRDMPADNLVEDLDISSLEKFDDPSYGNLMRRWWDFKSGGFLSKSMGSMMLDISVQRVPENTRKKIHDRPYNICDRLDFLLTINESLHNEYGELIKQTADFEPYLSYGIPGIASLLGHKLQSECRDHVFNNQKWIGYSAGGPYNQLIVGLVTPLTSQLYIEVVYTYSPDRNILPMDFLNLAYQKRNLINNTLKINYSSNNPIGDCVGGKDWLKVTNDQILERHRDTILVPLFGPSVYEMLDNQKALIEETHKAFIEGRE